MSKSDGASSEFPTRPPAITSLSVSGFKSIVDKQTIEIRPLTLLAGANSSGKSSMMQPLLLLKQTLEAPYDPGPLLLNGPNVRFTSAREFYPVMVARSRSLRFSIALEASHGAEFEVDFQRKKDTPLELESNLYVYDNNKFIISKHTTLSDVVEFAQTVSRPEFFKAIEPYVRNAGLKVERDRFYLTVGYPGDVVLSMLFSPPGQAPFDQIGPLLLEIIHLPGIRGNPRRTYPVTGIGPTFPGTFENYAASLISDWHSRSPERIRRVSEDLRSLGLTWKIEAKAIDDTQVELRVGRMRHRQKGGERDLVSIADMGFGVSQTLPVVVALRAARPGQLVYIEQPEVYLHPRAQVAMARLLVNAANRGVRVVAETHSSLILLAVQTLVAEGVIEPGLVGLNWFIRDQKDGTTRIKRADLDEAGRFGDWPEDFDEVMLEAENRYLSAAEARIAKG
jgi:hypothetical protein